MRYYEKVESMPTKYGGKSHITILPGIGIGPEIMTSTLKILNAAEAPLTYEIMNTDPEDELEEKFNQVLISIRRNKVALKVRSLGIYNPNTQIDKNFRLEIRKRF